MAKNKLDQNQLLAVNSINNTIVSAGAGSGKTTVLAQRYLNIIEKDLAGVDNILTLTFTKKAASEMYERIYKSLLKNAHKENIKEAINNFSKSSISTMDSFCTNIVRNNSNYFGVANDFKIDPSSLNSLAESASYDFLFRNYNNKVLKLLLKNWGFDKALEDFFKKLALDYFNFGFEINFKENLKKQIEFIYKELNVNIENFYSICKELENLEAEFKALKEFKNSLVIIKDIKSNIEKEEWGSLLGNLKTIPLRKNTGSAKSFEIEFFKEKIDELKTIISSIESICNYILSIPDFTSLFDLLEIFKKDFLDLKRKSGILAYKDLNLMALEILKMNPGLRNYYKKKYKFIMIDEFQDNNELQRDLLYYLAEKESESSNNLPEISNLDTGKLFFVGDDKQSIYRFRGGDVSVFKSLCSEISKIGGDYISLDTNYRSDAPLIDFFNKVFPDIMANSGEAYEADYNPLKSKDYNDELNPQINIFIKEDNKKTDSVHNDDAEAYFLANYIKDAVENKKLKISKDGSLKYAEYSDFAILMRSTSNQIKYERIFRRKAIPYKTQGVRALFMEAPVNDIYSLLQLLVYSDDRTAYGAFIRSPLVNLSDDAFYKILVQKTEAFEEEGLEAELSEVDYKKYLKGKALYTELFEEAKTLSISELISYIWFDFGYRYLLLQNPDYHIYLEYYEYLIKLAESFIEKGKGLVSFLDFIRKNLGEYEKIDELDIDRSSEDGVNILTIHKSKGLQFPVVILANAGNIGRQNMATPFYYSENYGISLSLQKDKNANYFYIKALELEEKKQKAELKRLLYVALTRAENHLFISGVINSKNRNSDKSLFSMLLKATKYFSEDQELPKESIFIKIPEISEEEYFKGKKVSENKSPFKIMDLYKNVRCIKNNFVKKEYTASELNSLYKNAFAGNSEKLNSIESDKIIKKHELEAVFGTLCHYLIEKNISNSESSESSEIPDKFMNILPKEFAGLILKDANKLADNFLNSDFYSTLNMVNVNSEVSFLLKEDADIYIKGQIDLWIELNDKIIIIDFKTDMEINTHLYYPQLAVYKKAAEEISGKEVEVYLCYLRDAVFKKYDKNISLQNILRAGK